MIGLDDLISCEPAALVDLVFEKVEDGTQFLRLMMFRDILLNTFEDLFGWASYAGHAAQTSLYSFFYFSTRVSFLTLYSWVF